MPSVLIVDDEDDMRFLVRWMIEEAAGDWYVVGEARSADEGFTRWRELRPDFVIIDHLLPGQTGLDAARRILAEDPSQCILLLSMIGGEDVQRAATAAGVALCVSKANLQDLPALLSQLAAERSG